jgi:non-canonical (house-cleaning) NTP pyrophosphatase
MTKLIMLAAGMKKQSGKERALMTALARFEHPHLRAELFNVTSGVDEQPIGDVMDLGAENRAIGAVRAANQERELPTCHHGLELSKLPEFSYGIGAESGVQLRRGFIIDSTTVIIVHRTSDDSFKTIALHTSEGVPMPTKHFNVAVERGVREHTGGSVYAENARFHRQVRPHGQCLLRSALSGRVAVRRDVQVVDSLNCARRAVVRVDSHRRCSKLSCAQVPSHDQRNLVIGQCHRSGAGSLVCHVE